MAEGTKKQRESTTSVGVEEATEERRWLRELIDSYATGSVLEPPVQAAFQVLALRFGCTIPWDRVGPEDGCTCGAQADGVSRRHRDWCMTNFKATSLT